MCLPEIKLSRQHLENVAASQSACQDNKDFPNQDELSNLNERGSVFDILYLCHLLP
jgi:hypothetical protein